MHAAHLSFFQNVAPKAGTPGEAAPVGSPAPAQSAPPAQSPLMTFFPILILLPFLFMMFRRQKREQAARASLKRGDRVMTQAGLIGELMELGEPTSKLKIAAGVTIEVLSSSLQALPTVAPKTDAKVDAKVATAEKK